MLHIWYGDYEKDNYIYNPDTWFDNQADYQWLTDVLSREMIKDIDQSEVISENLIQSSKLGPIPPQWLSGGVKTLILIDHDQDHVFNATACGDNCAKWLLEIGNRKDVLVSLGYIKDFGDKPFEIYVENTDDVVHDMRTLINVIIYHDLL